MHKAKQGENNEPYVTCLVPWDAGNHVTRLLKRFKGNLHQEHRSGCRFRDEEAERCKGRAEAALARCDAEIQGPCKGSRCRSELNPGNNLYTGELNSVCHERAGLASLEDALYKALNWFIHSKTSGG